MQQFRWRRAAVFVEADSGGQGLQVAFQAQAETLGLDLSFFYVDSSAASWSMEFRRLSDSTYRVAVITATPTAARLAGAVELGLLDNSEWAFVALKWCDIPQSTLTADHMRGMICVRQLRASGPAFESWKARFSQRPVQQSSLFSPANTIGVAYTNVGWLIVRALQRVLYANATEAVASTTGAQLRNTLLNISMVGVDGRVVEFDANGDVQRHFEIVNFLHNAHVPLMFAQWGTKLGEYAPSSQRLMMEPDFRSRVVFGGGSSAPARDHPLRSLRSVNDNVRLYVNIVTFLTMSIVCVYARTLVARRTDPVVKRSSPKVGVVSLLGAAMLTATLPLMAHSGDSTRVCIAMTWLTSLGLQTMLLPLIAKTWRLHRIFNARRISSIRTIKDAYLYKVIVAGVAIDCALMATWQLKTQPTARLVSVRNARYVDVWVCREEDEVLALVLLLLPKMCVSLYGSVLAWRVRTIQEPDFNDSRSLGNAVLVIVCSFVLIVPLHRALHPVNPSLALVVVATLLSGCVTLSMSIMYARLVSCRPRASVLVDSQQQHPGVQQRRWSHNSTRRHPSPHSGVKPRAHSGKTPTTVAVRLVTRGRLRLHSKHASSGNHIKLAPLVEQRADEAKIAPSLFETGCVAQVPSSANRLPRPAAGDD
eukprot:TRINITY_DN47811_c0_g1_i1.p1 TRINITY_DN47811_c0_g1~~TRINITY_DN47811_c0_g1_i1.p1  ORF type:complete len:649 (-),score=231.58 TRINITY_DN47811_c0_g1_i1:66-2012(-)